MSEISDATMGGSTSPLTAKAETVEPFDFGAHARGAAEKYRLTRGTYADCAAAVHSVLVTALGQEKIQVSSLEYRAKTVESFEEKARRPSETDSETPQYPAPIEDIMDLSGVRVITFLLSTVPKVNAVIERDCQLLLCQGLIAFCGVSAGAWHECWCSDCD